MGIAISGLASGIDSDGIIAQLMAIEERQIFTIQRRIAQEEQKRSAYEDLTGRVDSVSKAASNFNKPDIFGKMQVTSSNSAVLSASNINGEAKTGTYSATVKQVATTHRIAAQGFVDKSGTGVAAADGTFSFRLGDSGTVTEIDVGPSMSLQGLANAINDSRGSVSASIVKDGTGSNPFRMVLTSTKEGEAGTVNIVDNDTTLDFSNKQIEAAFTDRGNSDDYEGEVTSSGTYTGTANTTYIVEIMTEGAADGTAKYRLSTDGGLTFNDNGGAGFDVTSAGPVALGNGVNIAFEDNGTLREGDSFSIDVFNPELRTPQDAILEVNGITVRKSSNTVSDVFEGISMNLSSAAPNEEINIVVQRDAGSVEEALMGFVGAYNGAMGFLNAQFSYDPADGGYAPPLNGDSAARQVDRDLKRLISTRMEGLGSNTASTLSELGISSNEKTGLLSFSPMELNNLMRDDPSQVEAILTRFGERSSGDITFNKRTAATRPGSYDVTVSQARTRAEVSGADPAEALAGDEQLTIRYNRRAQNNDNTSDLTIDLLAGDTPDDQVTKINTALAESSLDVTAFLNATGQLTVRANEYGEDYRVHLISDLAGGVGTTGIGNVELDDYGTDLIGLIGGTKATTINDTMLRGDRGYSTEGIEVTVPTDLSGNVGTVRVVNGLAHRLPEVTKGLTGSRGILRSRSNGVGSRITDLENEIMRQERRMATKEQRLRRQFTSMEVTMGKLEALGDYVTQQMEAISASTKKK